MPTVNEGSAASATLTASSTIAITLASPKLAHVAVRRAGVLLFSQQVNRERTIGPYAADDVVTISADRGDVDYTVAAAPIVPTWPANPGAGTFALQSVNDALAWTAVV